MAADLLQIALTFLENYGLYAVFVLLVLDGAMLMPVLPGEAVMIMAVTQYAQSLSDLGFLVALTTAAGVVGSLILYGMARVGGRPLIESHPRLFMMDKRRRESLEESFQKPLGQSLVLFLRVIPLTRIIVNIPAGLAKMPLGRFLVLSSIGMALFHAGFLWLAFEYQQPGSAVATQATALQEAYGQPAWQYLQANETIAILGAIVLGAYLSLRSSRRMLKYPDGAVVSILGWIAVRVLVLGSMAVGAVLAYNPQLVYDTAIAGGLDIPAIARALEFQPVPLLGYVLGATWCVGVILWALEAGAKRRRDRVQRERDRERDEQLRRDLEGDSTGEDLDFDEVSS